MAMGAANGEAMGAANGEAMGATNGEAMGAAKGEAMGAAIGMACAGQAPASTAAPTQRVSACERVPSDHARDHARDHAHDHACDHACDHASDPFDVDEATRLEADVVCGVRRRRSSDPLGQPEREWRVLYDCR
eukprot:1922068-Prymnesium_polylepis.1